MKSLLSFMILLSMSMAGSHAQILKTISDKAKETFDKKTKSTNQPPSRKDTIPSTEHKKGSLEDDESDNEVNFKRGNQILFQDNFEKDAIGDFPANWNTTQGGEVKKLKGYTEKWLKVPGGSVVNIELKKPLPENFTVEMDWIFPEEYGYARPSLGFGKKPSDIDYLIADKDEISVNMLYSNRSGVKNGLFYASHLVNNSEQKRLDYEVPLNKKVHVAIEVNGTRFRCFIDDKKMIDLPKHFLPDYRKSIFLNAITSGWTETKTACFYVSNVVIAATGKDERSQVLKDLIDKGSFSTNAILFAVNSDKIQPSSNAIINEIANALKVVPDMKLKITGHTDSDGDDAKNLTLSQKRAAAVKVALIAKGINPARLQTTGKGETEPIADNGSEEGKAQNRRVEFTKM